MINTISVLGMKLNKTSYEDASDLMISWCRQQASRYVCVATVNNVMESYDSPNVRQVMNSADLVTSDGMPLVWALKLMGYRDATRVYGPDLTPILLKKAAAEGIPVGFYGAAPDTLARLVERVRADNPTLQVVYQFSPPFRPLTEAEDAQVMRNLNESGAKLLFVGLNSPKQDFWMAEHKTKFSGVMIGVGAAFDFLAGSKRQAPRWMMATGLEWLFRLATEPRRLWKRYLKHNPRFIVLFALQLLHLKRSNLRAGQSV